MATISRVRCEWSGVGVTGPSVSTHYFAGEAAADFQPWLVTFYDNLHSALPSNVTIAVPNVGDELDSATGDVTGTWSAGTRTTTTGEGSANHAQGVGGRIVWVTNGRTNNRPVRGTTFIVPFPTEAFGTDGTIVSGWISDVTAAANALLTSASGGLVIWTRPTAEHAGTLNSVLSAFVPSEVSWLRSRRT